jgi:hypothetical protein
MQVPYTLYAICFREGKLLNTPGCRFLTEQIIWMAPDVIPVEMSHWGDGMKRLKHGPQPHGVTIQEQNQHQWLTTVKVQISNRPFLYKIWIL